MIMNALYVVGGDGMGEDDEDEMEDEFDEEEDIEEPEKNSVSCITVFGYITKYVLIIKFTFDFSG